MRLAPVLAASFVALVGCHSGEPAPARGAASDPDASSVPLPSGAGALASGFDPESIAPGGPVDPHAHHHHPGMTMPMPSTDAPTGGTP